MARSIWKGSIAFGLVNIPVELYSATRDHRPKFRLLHAKDEEPVRYERVCQKEGKPVAWEDLVKGYEYAKGHFVVITKDDFKTAALEKTKTIDIIDFVDPKEIDERYFETPYYLQAGKGAERSYALLREAIRDSGRIGIAKIILREAQHLAAVEAIGDALVLTMMRFADELADLGRLHVPAQGRHPAGGAENGAAADRQPGGEVEAREVHRRVHRQPDEGDQRQGQGQAAAAGRPRTTLRNRRKSLI